MAGGAASDLSRGGMRTKIEAGKIATAGGTHMIIADGRVKNPLGRIAAGGRCTWFLTPSTPSAARKTWIAGSLEPRGVLHVDEGAARALRSGASLLPVGVARVEGSFARGDAVTIRDAGGASSAAASSPTTRGGGPHHRSPEPRDRRHSGLCRPRRDGAPGRHGALRRR